VSKNRVQYFGYRIPAGTWGAFEKTLVKQAGLVRPQVGQKVDPTADSEWVSSPGTPVKNRVHLKYWPTGTASYSGPEDSKVWTFLKKYQNKTKRLVLCTICGEITGTNVNITAHVNCVPVRQLTIQPMTGPVQMRLLDDNNVVKKIVTVEPRKGH
jgi:hypothetical protein